MITAAANPKTASRTSTERLFEVLAIGERCNYLTHTVATMRKLSPFNAARRDSPDGPSDALQ